MTATSEPSATGSLRLPALTIFLSAFLLFQVQPLVGKLLLPWFGGSAGVWTTCLLFFQLLLLLGYFYAHAVVRHLSQRSQVVLHGSLILLACLALPLRLHGVLKPVGTEEPVMRLLGNLLLTVGLPYFLLSTTGPLVQTWVARKGHVPYRLFALSNLASMLALLSYPILVEPVFQLRIQTWTWSAGFVVFGCLVLLLARRSAHAVPEAELQQEVATPPDFGLKLIWTLMAAVPSVLLMAVTSHLSTNVAPIPFLWVLPLALYLLSFILCFESHRWYQRGVFLTLLPVAMVGLTLLIGPEHRHTAVRWQVAAFASGLFIVCMVAHGELARLRPHPRHLTGFYLRLSLGGALGGLLVALVAPHLFKSHLELPFGFAAALGAAFVALAKDPGRLSPWVRRSAMLVFAALCVGIGAHAWRSDHSAGREAVARGRNFYGTLHVFDSGQGKDAWRVLAHGTITHGAQFLDPERRTRPVTYYSADSGVGLSIANLPEGPRRLGVIGLGAGSLAVWGRKGDLIRFYDINPLVETFARRHFTYLQDSAAKVEVAMGDARLTLDREAPQHYDLLALDAFSSDAIPVHLLTREAFGFYLKHLRPGGVLAVHVSNRYLNLRPVVRAAAEALGFATLVVDTDGEDDAGIYGSTWILLSKDPDFFRKQAFLDSKDVVPLEGESLAWTDDFSNLYRILK
jgi:hypothetical protein